MRYDMQHRWILSPKALAFLPLAALLIILVACGDSNTPTPRIVTVEKEVEVVVEKEVEVEVEVIKQVEVTPTQSAAEAAAAAKQTVTLVYGDQPENLGVWGNPGCAIIPVHAICQDLATDVLTYIDSTTFEVVPLSGVQGWEMVEPDRWRFTLTEGVKFHNGEPWNAAAAKMGIDWQGDEEHGQASVSYTDEIHGEVVDDLTVDVVCDRGACPIMPTTGFLIGFQAPEWWTAASEAERTERTIGFGPYVQGDWRKGVDVTMEIYDDYKPNAQSPRDSRFPTIEEVKFITRGEQIVRAAMVQVDEAQWAWDLGSPEFVNDVPVLDHGGAAETFVDVFDGIWHPELKKTKVRQALAYATDCATIVEEFYLDFYECQGTYAPPGTLGVTPRTLAPYPYDPDKARELLAEAEYDEANEIVINVFAGRFFRNVEVAEAQAQMWRNVGVNASIANLETAKWLDVARTGCGRAWREAKGDDHEFSDDPTFCTDLPPGPPCYCQPHTYQLNPSLETLDFGRATKRFDCRNSGSKFCDLEIQPKLDIANTAFMPERETLLQELVDYAYDEMVMYTYFNGEVFYGVSEDLTWSPRFDRRPRVNQWDLN